MLVDHSYQDPSDMEKQSFDELDMNCTAPDCGSTNFVTDSVSGEVICSKCGLVLIERSVDQNPEKINDPSEFATKTRTGPEQSLTMYDKGMTTIISERDAMGHSLDHKMRNTFGRLKILNNRSVSATTSRTLRSALVLLHALKSKLGIPESAAENAAYIYRKAMQKRITIGRSSKSLMCAAVYVACKQIGIPRSVTDISKAADVGRKEINRSCRNIIEKLDLSLEPVSASGFLTKLANQTNVSEKTRRNALKMITVLEQKSMSDGKNPVAMAATALYLSCIKNGEYMTQSEIARVSGITAVTIRNRCTFLKKNLGLID